MLKSKENEQQQTTPGMENPSPRQSIIYGALCGWKGDGENIMSWPETRDLIIDFGNSFYKGDKEELEKAFNELVNEGLYFQVHPEVFMEPTYYCSLDIKFLKEIPDGDKYAEFWGHWSDQFDKDHGDDWRRNGLCNWRLCGGANCYDYKEGKDKCQHELRFKHGSKE